VREQRARDAAAKPAAKAKRAAQPKASARQDRARTRSAERGDRSQRELEKEIDAAESALRTIEDELADPSAWAGAEASARSADRHEQAKRTVEQLYERLERIAG
jgi:ATP-binding cassette subfamily F protein 3